jgi:hypothetical protein
MAASEYARGRKITVSPVPKELTYFSLAKEFHWLPDEIDRQEPKKIKGIMHILSVYNSVKNQETEQANRKAKNRR